MTFRPALVAASQDVSVSRKEAMDLLATMEEAISFTKPAWKTAFDELKADIEMLYADHGAGPAADKVPVKLFQNNLMNATTDFGMNPGTNPYKIKFAAAIEYVLPQTRAFAETTGYSVSAVKPEKCELAP